MTDQIPETMQAVVYRGVDDLRVETVPVPRIHPDELLVKVAVCGICPTDIKKIHYGTVEPPRIFGHETSGVIVRVGSQVRKWKIRDRVALHHHVPCLSCHACRHHAFAQCTQYKRTGITAGFEPAGGGFSEYVRVMAFVLPGVVKIPASKSFVEGAMIEPVNTVLKAVKRLALLKGDCVLVVGQGPIGLLFTQLLTAMRLKVIAIDLLDHRLKRARDFGARLAASANDTKLSSAIECITRRRGLDAAIVTAPSDAAVRQALELVRGGGQVLIFAHTRRGSEARLDLSTVCVDEKDLLGSYSADWTLQNEAAHLVFRGKLDVLSAVTHRFPLVKTADAIRLAMCPTPETLKIIIDQEFNDASETQ
jgi:L-iditol 2-dehydrogenase